MTDHVFGPVASRRLGRSLGVDLVPFKTCTYDCIYCQLGRTTCKTLERREWVPLGDLLEELGTKLATKPDYITLSGSGEPTLFSRIGVLVDGIKAMTDVPVAILTNGSLLWQEEVRTQLMNADLIVPSLDAANQEMHRAVNRPHEGISFENVLEGLIDLRREFRGQYWLEIFLLAGHTAIDAEVAGLVKCVDLIKPDRVQLNTVARPPAESYAVGASHDRMLRLASMFSPPAEVISHVQAMYQQPEFPAGLEDVLKMLRRRPCSIDDIANGLGINRAQAVKYVEELNLEKLIEQTTSEGRLYYRVAL